MKIRIRPLQGSDAVTSVVWRNDSELWGYTKFKADHEITVKDEQDWIDRVSVDPTSARFAITADNVYVGNIYLTGIKDGSAEYHIFIGDKSYWGKGIAREASNLIIEYGRDVLKLNRINLFVHVANVSARHLYAKLGFLENGKKEDNFIEMTLNLSD